MIFYQVGIGQSHDFCQAYNLFVTEVASFTLKRCGGANDAMRDTNKLPGYMPDKSNVIIIIINTQGQIAHIYFIRKDCLTGNHFVGCKFHLQPALCHLARKKEHFRGGTLLFGHV